MEAILLGSIDAEHNAEELIKVFARVELPEEILTDHSVNFASKLLQDLYQLLNIQAVHTSPYHAQCDGLLEHFNQTLKMMLRKVVMKEVKIWRNCCHNDVFLFIEKCYKPQQISHHLTLSMVMMSVALLQC